VDDEEIEGGSAEDYLLEVGSGSFVPGVEDRMIGMKKGETKEIWVDIPEDYQSKVIAGKRVKFVVNVKDIKNKKLPELDDDLAKNVGFDTLEEYMEDARKRMGGLKKSQIDAAVRDQIIKKVTRAAKVDVPTVMTEQKLDSMIVDFGRNLEGKGITLGQYFEASGKTLEDLRETLREEAVYQVKSDLVLEAVAKAEGLEPEEQEVDMEISALATVLDKTPEETRKMLMANGRINFVVERVMVRKTVDRLLEKAEIKAKPAPESDETAAKPAGKKASKAVPAAGKRAKKAKTEEAGETSEKPAANEKRDEE
ncbi:MAG: trigger factor, partial [Chloroflexi bacterium]|nr:trigger factor [Chloroflexota bacterium]